MENLSLMKRNRLWRSLFFFGEFVEDVHVRHELRVFLLRDRVLAFDRIPRSSLALLRHLCDTRCSRLVLSEHFRPLKVGLHHVRSHVCGVDIVGVRVLVVGPQNNAAQGLELHLFGDEPVEAVHEEGGDELDLVELVGFSQVDFFVSELYRSRS